jgi:hypothetical protein
LAEQQQETKQIPVISDIERIKKVIEILEFVGGKVDDILESLPVPQSQTSHISPPETEANKNINTEETTAVVNTTDSVKL